MRTDVNIGIFVAIIAAIFIGWLLMRTKVGYEMRAVGFNRDAAQFTGINVKKTSHSAWLFLARSADLLAL